MILEHLDLPSPWQQLPLGELVGVIMEIDQQSSGLGCDDKSQPAGGHQVDTGVEEESKTQPAKNDPVSPGLSKEGKLLLQTIPNDFFKTSSTYPAWI